MSARPRCEQWRDDLERYTEIGVCLEAIARELPGEFEVRPQWPGIDWVAHGRGDGDLATFASMVRLASEVLGAPDECGGKHWLGGGERVPDLVASWKIDRVRTPFLSSWENPVEITVRMLMPKDCKIDPRQPGRAKAEDEDAALHPECAGFIRDLVGKLDNGAVVEAEAKEGAA